MASTSNQIDSSYYASSSSSSTPPPPWDVFLSFRGEDTRKNFIGHLYSALDRTGIRAFMDDPELQRGEEISPQLLKAIQESKVSIVVFSENYASSSWCLDELVKILECKRTMGQIVIPVFYNVDPSVVRHKKRSFAEAFESHKERLGTNMEIVEKWEGALTEAANLSGYDLQNDANGHEAKLIQIVVQKVLLEIDPICLNVAKQPVGIESRVEYITPLLSIGTNDIRRIGIYGMGGIGKTTIAKALFNENFHYFEGSCFLANVREASEEHNGILRLQEQLLFDILKVKKSVENVDKGISLLKERLRLKKVLIVLDDLDHLSQSDQLAGQWNQFALGSRIIITTRDAGVLDQIEVEERYNVEELDDDESLELFSRHVFKKSVPSEGYMEISKGIVCQAGGLPLALEVLGSYLFKRTMIEWRSSLDKLQQIPRNEIQKKLMISYDALGDGDLKDVFLDIACFFIGKDKEMTISILNSCGFNSENKIIILVERCLLSINDENKLRMHDLLRDMGREIVNKESPKEPGKRSRLWSNEDIYNVLKKQKGTEAIEGIIIPYERKLQQVTLNTEIFERMDKLRLLDIKGLRLTGNFEYIFKELRWLSWQRCELQCLPSDFHPEKLVILDLQFSEINILWHGILFLEQLKILNLNGCNLLTTTPDFTRVPNLEKLLLAYCTCLVEIHPSIGHLSRLACLDLTFCEELSRIPNSICNLRALESLSIFGCSNLKELPEELGNIERLSRLVGLNLEHFRNRRTLPSRLRNFRALERLHNSYYNIPVEPEEMGIIESLRMLKTGHTAITKLPNSIGRLSRLVDLDLGHFRNLRTLPSSLCNLRVLESLNLNNCDNLEELPEELGNIESLKELVAGHTMITKLPDSIGRLSRLDYLNLEFCRNLRTLPSSLCNLRELESLNLNNCNNLEELPEELGTIESLKVLHIGHTAITKLPNSIGRLSRLDYLILGFCRNLRTLPSSLCNLRVLESLDLNNCDNLEELPEELGNIESLKVLEAGHTAITKLPNSIGRLSRLDYLNLEFCRNLRTLPSSLCNLRVLERLDLNNCNNLEELPEELGNIESLKMLRASHTMITKLPDSIGRLSRLDYLILEFCRNLRTLPSSLCNLRVLESLDLNNCDNLEELPEELGNIESLKMLDAGHTTITKLPDSIGRLSRLVYLNLEFCRNLRTLPSSLCNLRVLESLDLNNCNNLEELPEEMGNIESLKMLDAGHTAIPKLPDSIGRFSRLVNLNLEFCRNLRTLPSSLCNLRVLESLDLNNCDNLEELPEELGNIESLKMLKAGHTTITKLPNSIGRLSRLVHLNLEFCRNLRTLSSSLCNLRVLERLNLNNCYNLEELPEELGNIESLNVLHAGYTAIIKLPDSIERLRWLYDLNLEFCRNLRTIPSSFRNLRVWASLNLNNCDNLEE